jgi:hypothetical protein
LSRGFYFLKLIYFNLNQYQKLETW